MHGGSWSDLDETAIHEHPACRQDATFVRSDSYRFRRVTHVSKASYFTVHLRDIAAKHDQFHFRQLSNFAILVYRLAAKNDHAPFRVRARRRHLDDFGLDM